MENKGEGLKMELNYSKLEKLDASQVFKKVVRQLSSEKSRSLWRRMQSEMKSGSVRSTISWLESDLKQKSEQVREVLNRFKEVEK